MYFDTKKKEYTKDGRLCILKNRTIKMDYGNNLHRNDNDIFDNKQLIKKCPASVKKEDVFEKKLRVFST